MRALQARKPLSRKGRKRFGKKEAPSEDGALNERAEAKSKVVANGRGRRKRHLPVGRSRGRRIRLNPGVANLDRGRSIRCRSRRQSEYARGRVNQQCTGEHVSHACCAQK